jgi:hypothetical protein
MDMNLRSDQAIAESHRLREQRQQVMVKTESIVSKLGFQIEELAGEIGSVVAQVKVSAILSEPLSSTT